MYDVIVIGAGPCGNMAALELAERGISVAVLDRRTNIGDKLCTGIIGRECAELFPPATEHIHGEARSATIVSPGGRRYRIERKETHAYIVNRVAYVNSVAETGAASGRGIYTEHPSNRHPNHRRTRGDRCHPRGTDATHTTAVL